MFIMLDIVPAGNYYDFNCELRWEELVFSDNGGTSFPVIGKGTGF